MVEALASDEISQLATRVGDNYGDEFNKFLAFAIEVSNKRYGLQSREPSDCLSNPFDGDFEVIKTLLQAGYDPTQRRPGYKESRFNTIGAEALRDSGLRKLLEKHCGQSLAAIKYEQLDYQEVCWPNGVNAIMTVLSYIDSAPQEAVSELVDYCKGSRRPLTHWEPADYGSNISRGVGGGIHTQHKGAWELKTDPEVVATEELWECP